MELEQFQKIKDEQNESCAICNAKLKAGFMVHVDHDHKTGEVRGILCRWCNTGLGNFKDSIDNLKSAVKYLKKYCSKSAEK